MLTKANHFLVRKGTCSMRSSHSLDALSVQFDDDKAVADAGLLLPATLAQHLGLWELFYDHVDLGAAPGRANAGDKAMTVIASLIAGGECIDDADALRAGDSDEVLGHWVAAPSTLGTFLRAFSFGHSRQLDVVSGELLGRAWSAGAGPDEDEALTIDVDSTICETYGLQKQGGSKSPTTTFVATTHWSRSSHKPATSSTRACAVGRATRGGAQPASSPKASRACGAQGRPVRSRSGPTRASTTTRSWARAARPTCASRSPSR